MTGRPALSIFVPFAVAGFYVLSLFLPFKSEEGGTLTGLEYFKRLADYNADVFRGQAHGMDSVKAFAMLLPHPLLWAGVFLLLGRAYRGAAFAGVLANLLAVLYVFDPNQARLSLDGYHPGFFIWWGSLMLVMVGGFWGGASDY